MDSQHDEQLKIYEQLCLSYHAIDDFRAKLLGFLPLASAGGAFLLLNDVFVPKESTDLTTLTTLFVKPVALFGFVVTLGLLFYELYGILRCHALIAVGKHLERCVLKDK